MERSDGWLELRYDDAIRAVMPLGPRIVAPATGSPLGEQASGSLRLQGTGVTSLSCPDPKCVNGVPPLQHQPPEQIQFWMELQGAVDVEAIDGGASCLIVRSSGARVAVPMFDASLGTEGPLCERLTEYRERTKAGCMAFHVYRIAVAPASLVVLQDKRIALPIPSKYVMAAAIAERIRSSA